MCSRLQGVLYWLGWRAARRTGGRAAWLIVILGAVLNGLVLLMVYPFDAADIYDNIADGRILGIYGANPFIQVAEDFPKDMFYGYMAWRGSPSAYGPLWEIMAGVAARLGGDDYFWAVISFKLLNAIFLAGSVWVVARILKRRAPHQLLPGVLLLAWNPIVAYETLAHGHNDIVMVFFILLAAWAIIEGRFTLGILALLGGVLVKYIPVLLLPAAGMIALRMLPDNRARLRFTVKTGILGLLLVVAFFAPFWEGSQILSIERRTSMVTTSLPATVWAMLEPRWGDPRAAETVTRLALYATVVFSLYQGWRAWADREWHSFPRASFKVLMFYLLFACPWFQQWYAVWPLGLLPLIGGGALPALGHVFAFVAQSKAFIFAPAFLWMDPFPAQTWRELRLGLTVLGPVWLFALMTLPFAGRAPARAVKKAGADLAATGADARLSTLNSEQMTATISGPAGPEPGIVSDSYDSRGEEETDMGGFETRAPLWLRRLDEWLERRGVLVLAVTGPLTVLVYVLGFAFPYSLQKLFIWMHLDILGITENFPGFQERVLPAFVVVTLLYLVSWRVTLRVQNRDTWLIVLWTAAMAAIVMAMVYPFGSTDPFDYTMQARIEAVYHQNPFIAVALDHPYDQFTHYMGWAFAPSAYGPLWQKLAVLVVTLAGDGIFANVMGFKILAGIFLALSAVLLYLILKRFAPRQALPGLLLVLWNPIVLYETLGNAHNDVVMVFFMLLAVYASLNRRFTLSVLALVAGALVKFIPILMVPAAGLIALRELRDNRRRAQFVVVTALVSIALLVIFYAPYWEGPQILGIERREKLLTTSIAAVAAYQLEPEMGLDAAAALVSRIAGIITALFALWAGFRAWSDHSWRSLPRSFFYLSIFYMLFSAPWFMPWYSLWALMLIPLLDNPRWTRLAQVVALSTIPLRYTWERIFMWYSAAPLAEQQAGVTIGMWAIPWALFFYAVGATWLERRRKREAEMRLPAMPALARASHDKTELSQSP